MDSVTPPATPDTEAVEFDITYTAADFRNAQLWFRPLRRHTLALAWVIGMSACYAWAFFGGVRAFAIFVVLGLAAVAVYHVAWCPRRSLKSARPASWSISAAGARWATPGMLTSVAWERLVGVRLTHQMLLLELTRQKPIFVPVRVLPPGAAERIACFARAAGVTLHGFSDPA